MANASDMSPMTAYQGGPMMKTIAGKMAKSKPKQAKRKKTVAEDFPQESALTGPASASY